MIKAGIFVSYEVAVDSHDEATENSDIHTFLIKQR